MKIKSISILGGGNIGLAIAEGIVNSKILNADKILISRKRKDLLIEYKEKGFSTAENNHYAVNNSDLIIIAVQPQQLNEVLDEIKSSVNSQKHIIISVVSGASIKSMRNHLGDEVEIIRVMPNTAIAIKESMTCISTDKEESKGLEIAKQIFDSLGKTLVIAEDLMIPATALCACGIAFFLRAIRAASQGGIEIGFHSDEAVLMAAQTAKGAAELLLRSNSHPESEVDKVTTPRGITISGLNEMEHYGFSSAMIKGIVTSADKATKLYKNNLPKADE